MKRTKNNSGFIYLLGLLRLLLFGIFVVQLLFAIIGIIIIGGWLFGPDLPPPEPEPEFPFSMEMLPTRQQSFITAVSNNMEEGAGRPKIHWDNYERTAQDIKESLGGLRDVYEWKGFVRENTPKNLVISMSPTMRVKIWYGRGGMSERSKLYEAVKHLQVGDEVIFSGRFNSGLRFIGIEEDKFIDFPLALTYLKTPQYEARVDEFIPEELQRLWHTRWNAEQALRDVMNTSGQDPSEAKRMGSQKYPRYIEKMGVDPNYKQPYPQTNICHFYVRLFSDPQNEEILRDIFNTTVRNIHAILTEQGCQPDETGAIIRVMLEYVPQSGKKAKHTVTVDPDDLDDEDLDESDIHVHTYIEPIPLGKGHKIGSAEPEFSTEWKEWDAGEPPLTEANLPPLREKGYCRRLSQ